VLVFSLLVSRKGVPSWARKGIASVGSKRDLYTGFEDGAEVDRFEAWLTREFEEPAIESVRRAVDGERLRGDDVRRLAMFFAVQDLRTPAALIEFLRCWGSSLPGMIDDALQDSVAKLTAAIQSGMPAEQSPAPSGDFAKPVLVHRFRSSVTYHQAAFWIGFLSGMAQRFKSRCRSRRVNFHSKGRATA
jgi:hypothetical protein